MTGHPLPSWRKWLGVCGATSAVILFALAVFQYERYANDLTGAHTQERLQHARLLGLLWRFCFYGPVATSALSAFGRGLTRWPGIGLSLLTWVTALMILGAMCGPFGC
jgi:hypothetical protein